MWDDLVFISVEKATDDSIEFNTSIPFPFVDLSRTEDYLYQYSS